MAPVPMSPTLPVSDESSAHGALHGIRVLAKSGGKSGDWVA